MDMERIRYNIYRGYCIATEQEFYGLVAACEKEDDARDILGFLRNRDPRAKYKLIKWTDIGSPITGHSTQEVLDEG